MMDHSLTLINRRRNDTDKKALTNELENCRDRMSHMEETLVRQGEMLQTQAILQAQLQGMLQSQGVMIQRLNEKMEAQSTVIVQQGKDMSDMLQLFNASKMGIKAVVVVGSFASAVLAIIGAIAFFNH